MFVVVGLGNPGKEYEGTRHNIGFETVDLLAKRNNIGMNKIKFKSVYGEGNINGRKVMLVKPQTFMNKSGEAVREIYNFYKIPLENIIVIVDDIDIEFATIRIRGKGSAGSHNGLKSIISLLGNQNFPRIKIGIGTRKPRQDLSSFVLSKFSKRERQSMEEAVVLAAESIETIIKDDINKAMNEFNIR